MFNLNFIYHVTFISILHSSSLLVRHHTLLSHHRRGICSISHMSLLVPLSISGHVISHICAACFTWCYRIHCARRVRSVHQCSASSFLVYLPFGAFFLLPPRITVSSKDLVFSSKYLPFKVEHCYKIPKYVNSPLNVSALQGCNGKDRRHRLKAGLRPAV